jgi:hypothetical protein
VSGCEFNPPPEKAPVTQPTTSGGPPTPPPRPPKLIGRDLLDPGAPGPRIFVPDYIEINELAGLLQLRPFKVVADVLALGIFRHADELVDFSTAAAIAAKHGMIAEPLL